MNDSPETQITHDPRGHILTNAGVWSPDGRWIVYDTRSDPAGDLFDGQTIERVEVATGRFEVLYRAQRGACCGVATYSPVAERVVFILGPENPTPDWQYGPTRRQGVIVDTSRPLVAMNLDARDLVPPFTAGALRGGSHVHVFSGDGQAVSFTYEDEVLARLAQRHPGDPFAEDRDLSQRNIGVSIPARPVRVGRTHPRSHDGEYFTVQVTRTVLHPQPGTDQISRAFEDAWVGVDGYLRPDGARQKRAIAFQGHVFTADGRMISEAFIVDLPDDLTVPGDGPLQGTETRAPSPPKGTIQRRLTFTADREYPGLQGPRHWLRSSPDGSRIALLMKDEAGVVQLWTVSPNGGLPVQVTRNDHPIASAFTWSPDGERVAYVMDDSIWVTDVQSGASHRFTTRFTEAPRPEACVFSPDGERVVYVRSVEAQGRPFNQIFVVEASV